uniref:vomeronasal type-1 receptor 4-like n=1 Tax=Jaculus jaculus TaxID=51337 RepID=UPI001E1B3707|nr:vomeronasal type-1 receptor 4-like [Jaculus jaculus]
MFWNSHVQTIIYLFLTVPGIVGNILIFVRYVYNILMGTKKKSIDLILIHLSFSNILMICSTVIREKAIIVYFKISLGEVGCKVVVFLGRMTRGVSICTTCLLSIVQAVTINPRIKLWRKLKPQTAGQVLPYLLLFWMLNSLTSCNLLCYITVVRSMNRSVADKDSGSCVMLPSRQIVKWLFLSLMALRDVVFQSLMVWSSASMVLHLYKHHKRVSYLHSSSKCVNNSSPEIRATQSTLILMAMFLFFYLVDFILSFYTGFTVTQDSTTFIIKGFLELDYAILSSFVLLSRDVLVGQRGRDPEELTPQAGGTAESIRARWASLHPEALRTPVTITAVTRFAPRRGPGRADEERGDETPFRAPRAARGEAELRASAHRPAAPPHTSGHFLVL